MAYIQFRNLQITIHGYVIFGIAVSRVIRKYIGKVLVETGFSHRALKKKKLKL